jgi:hypothetical protein
MSNPPQTPSSPLPTPTPATDPQIDFKIGEEYGTARKSLPPIGIVAIGIIVVVAIAAIYSLTHRAHPLSTGTIDAIAAAPVPGQAILMVAVNVTLQSDEEKARWIKSIQVSTDVNGQTQSDDAAPAVDAQRYIDAFPDLKQHALQPLAPEARLNPGEKKSGTIVVSFPVTAEAFAARKSLTVTIIPYGEVPVVLTK